MSHRLTRAVAAASCTLVLLGAAGCSVKPETIRSYTPAHGVNGQAGDVKVRNLVIAVDDQGRGTLYGSLVSPAADKLTGVEGTATRLDGSAHSAITFTGATAELKPDQAVLLGNQQRTSVSSKDLQPGADARLTLTFERGGQLQLDVPVMDAGHPDYASAGASASPQN